MQINDIKISPEIICLIFLGIVFGALIVFAVMSLVNVHRRKIADFEKRIADLEAQVNGKQLPYFVKNGLEEIKALENADSFDLARMRLYLEETIKTVDQAFERQNKMGDVYRVMRNHKKGSSK